MTARRLPTISTVLKLGALAGTLAVTPAAGQACWTDVAGFAATANWPSGRISIDLENVRKRGRHFEVWERTLFDAPPLGMAEAGGTAGGLPEMRSLWAVRCRRGTIAVITAGLNGALPPRAERLEFHHPAPGSAGARIVGMVCSAARYDGEERPAARLESPSPALRSLAAPPEFIDPDDTEE